MFVRGPYWENAVPEVLSTAVGLQPGAEFKTSGTVFPNTNRRRRAKDVFIFAVLKFVG